MTITTYKTADGYNIGEGSLTTISPPPRMLDPIKAAEVNDYGDGTAQFNGFVGTTLEWNVISAAERVTLLALFGLSTTVASNEITISLNTNRVGSWTRYNTVASYRADERWSQLGVDNFHITLSQIEASS